MNWLFGEQNVNGISSGLLFRITFKADLFEPHVQDQRMASINGELSRNSDRIFDTGIINGGERSILFRLTEVKVGHEKQKSLCVSIFNKRMKSRI